MPQRQEDGSQLLYYLNEKRWMDASVVLAESGEGWVTYVAEGGKLEGSCALHVAAWRKDKRGPSWLPAFYRNLCRKVGRVSRKRVHQVIGTDAFGVSIRLTHAGWHAKSRAERPRSV